MHHDEYTGVIILIVGFIIIINYILEEFIFEEKKLNEISENKFSLKITHYTVVANDACSAGSQQFLSQLDGHNLL